MNALDCLNTSPSLDFFRKSLAAEPSLLIETLWDAPKAALIGLALQAKKNILVISGGTRENRLFDDLAYFGIQDVLEFPSWETLPGEEILPSPDIVGKRFETLHRLLEKRNSHLILCPLQSCLQKVLSPKTLKPLCKLFRVGDSFPFDHLSEFLTSLGYRRTPVAADKGEFALRGGILDIFPTSSPDPFRIDFFGDAIDQIRNYDPIGQKSISKKDSAFIAPASELELLKKETNPSFIFDYLGPDTLVIFDDLLALEDRYASIKGMPGASSRFFASFEEFLKKIQSMQKIFWTHERAEELSEVRIEKKIGRAFYSGKQPLQPLSFHIFQQQIDTKRWLHPFREIADFFSLSEDKSAATPQEILQGIKRFSKSNLELRFICSTETEEKNLKERIKAEEAVLPSSTSFDRGYLSSGFAVEDRHFALIPMTEFTHRYRTRRQKWRNTYHTPASDFHELATGDIVVHFHNGIGRYLGIEKKLNHVGTPTEFLVIEYAEESKLYVPVSQSHLVSRYIGSKEEIPTFSTLGTQKWQRTKLHAQKAIIGYAQDLLRMSAERTLKGGFAFPPDGEELEAFEQDFPFIETEDQLQAIADAKKDMLSPNAMDRLICGDVGYGKTEVAMRAAFKAVADGKKQVAVLVPTTILAMQHYESFRDRMANFPINIGIVSRFCSSKEIKDTLQKTADGSIDILIGTHRLISKDVVFKDLGLIVIDEEQRFGVRAKEHLKALKSGVDCLTLSATPIPRTLYLSLIGARSISVINTPPQDRLPIKTIISERDPHVVQNALLRELARDGQAFFIHNRVDSIFLVTEEIQKLLPEARIVTGHGQMSPDEIDTVFHAFKNGDADILVATTIVENGIDISNANTILIDRSDQFGLADLYQLRGRVGRWNKPAYAYFLTPPKRQLPELTRKRLHAMLESAGYGGGMKIAMRDLEIRGAGDILGTQQSGQISAIGFHLYCKLLKKTVDSMQKKTVPTFTEVKMEFSYDARLPEEYINESSLRLELYHRLGDTSTSAEVDAILEEMKDRFGDPPEQVIWLYHLTRLRVFAAMHHFTL
ncbi:MAG TPA: transcription-repair coupling factor, partial [Rhabdochlamydiaceae bacterium]|nr:transcription-repair coupling factor [Rhabdochlamydiaceae bacterium]